MAEKQWLAEKSENLINEIIKEDDVEKFQELENKFKLTQRKKNLVRVDRLTKAIEMADDEVIERLTVEPEGWKNDELIKYVESSQKAVDSMLNTEDKPLIQINHNEVNLNQSGLNRESRQKVLEAVQEILRQSEVIEVKDENE